MHGITHNIGTLAFIFTLCPNFLKFFVRCKPGLIINRQILLNQPLEFTTVRGIRVYEWQPPNDLQAMNMPIFGDPTPVLPDR
jgi:hypothetical protein